MNYEYLYEHEPSKNDNESGVFRSIKCKNKDLIKDMDGLKTIYDMAQSSIKKFVDKECYGYRIVEDTIEEKKMVEKKVNGEIVKEEKTWQFFKKSKFHWLSYAQFGERIDYIGSALVQIGLNKNDKLAIFSPTGLGWISMAHACFTQSLSIVTVYDTLGEDGLIHALEECEITTLFTDDLHLKMIKNVCKKVPKLTNIIYEGKKSDLEIENCKVHHYDDFMELGKNNKKEHQKPEASDVACTMYTSGTTGNPKGVLITHENVISTAVGVDVLMNPFLEPTDILSSFLPLSHILAFATDIYLFGKGIKIGYCNPRTLVDTTVRECKGDLRELKPTLMVGVPQVYDSIRKGIMVKVNTAGGLSKSIFEFAFDLKSKFSNSLTNGILDAVVFNKVKEQTGGKLKWCVSGGAPLSDEVRTFISTSITTLSQGYGLTETCGLSVVTTLDIKDKTVAGQLSPQNEIKLVDFEEANYSHKNTPPQGELWFRGGSIVKGYYKNEKDTKEAFTEDGWFKTGDIVQINSNGTLSIIDRKKNLVKLANGEYIALEKLESIYRNCVFVLNICICANSSKNKPVALIVPNLPALIQHYKKEGKNISENIADINEDSEISKLVFKSCITEGNSNGLKGTELLASIYLCPEEWTVDNDMLTAAQKLKRRKLEEKYKDNLDKLFESA